MEINSSSYNQKKNLSERVKFFLKQCGHAFVGYLIFYVFYLSSFWTEMPNYSGFLGIAALTATAGMIGAFASNAYLAEFGAHAVPRIGVPLLLMLDLGTGTYIARSSGNDLRFEAGIILTAICAIWLLNQIRKLVWGASRD